MRVRTGILALLVLGLLGLPVGQTDAAISDATGPLDTDTDLNAALALEERILDHFHFGQVHEQHYRTAARETGDIATLVGENDSALYTGNYLAAESYRYALAKKELAAAAPASPEHDFWQEQFDDAKDRVDRMADQFHILINISKSWQTTFDPHINQDREPTEDGYIDFGGGVFPGEAGHLFRACNPIDAPAPINVGRDPSRDRLVGPLRWEDGKDYYCLDATSRDAYAGTTFGLATALDFVGPDDKTLRRMIAGDLMAMTDYAVKYLWFQPRPHGEVVIPEVFGGNDLDNFISPLFVHTPMAQLNMLQVARRAAAVAGTAQQKQRYETLWLATIPHQLTTLALSMELDNGEPHDSYYKFHLNHLTGFNLIRLERNVTVRNQLRAAFGVMDATTRDDVNALFEAMTYALTGETSRRDDAVVHHRQWLDYRANGDASGNLTKNSDDCGDTIVCVPQDQRDIIQPLPTGGEQVVTVPGSAAEIRAALPLPVALRRQADFMWQKDPTILDGNEGATWESPAADFLLPYWMLRYYTEAKRPARAPFPAWPGPRFR